MRNHYLLYVALPDGEEGEFELIGESNSLFPTLWSVLFAASAMHATDVPSAFGTTAQHVIVADANSAVERLETLSRFLCTALDASIDSHECKEISYADVARYLRGAVDHLRRCVAAWSFADARAPLFAISFDEAQLPAGKTKQEIIDACVQGFAAQWAAIQSAISDSCVENVCSHLGVDDFTSSRIGWKKWAGRFGLALFTHDYFFRAFRQPLRVDFADFAYDPLGSEEALGDGRFRFKQGDRWGVEFRDGERHFPLLSPEWDRVLRAATERNDLVWIERDGRFGLASVAEGGRILRDTVCDEVWPFHDGIALVRVDSKMGYLCTDGRWLLEPQWDEAWEFCCGFAVISVGDKLTYIDRSGRMLVPPTFDEATPFTSAGVARVRRGERYGLLRHDGTYALDVGYQTLEWCEDFRVWHTCRHGECALVRSDGSKWLHGPFERYSLCAAGRFISVHTGDRIALMNWSGAVLFQCEAQRLKQLQSGRAFFVVENKGASTLLDDRGVPVLPAAYSQVAEFESMPLLDCLRVTRKDSGKPRHGAWDVAAARELVPCRYDVIFALPLHGAPQGFGFLVATKTHVSSHARGLTYKVGLLHADGSMLVPEQYAWIGDPISLGKAGARNRLCSTIEFATLDERALTAVRWDTGTTEEIAVSALLRVGQGEPLSTPHA